MVCWCWGLGIAAGVSWGRRMLGVANGVSSLGSAKWGCDGLALKGVLGRRIGDSGVGGGRGAV